MDLDTSWLSGERAASRRDTTDAGDQDAAAGDAGDQIAFTPVGQVVTTNDFQPNFGLLAPCEQLSQQCELDAPSP